MGLIPTKKNEKLNDIKLKDPRAVFVDLLKSLSGASQARQMKFDIFYQIIGFKGVVEGVGCSTLVANTAIALSRLGLNVCVFDTSILNPVQDILLKTNYKNNTGDKKVDWLDIHRTNRNIVNTSKISSKIGVLSFQDRTVVDILSSSDSPELVELALTQLHNKYDVILIDICHELSSIATACLQSSQKVIQVWGNAPHVLNCIDGFIKNNTICCCPLDKMRNVVTSMTIDDVRTNWDLILKRYNFNHLAHVGLSIDVARCLSTGKSPFNFPSSSEDIQEFNNCIADIVCHILNISNDEEEHTGTYTISDIVEGKVKGTLTNKLVEDEKANTNLVDEKDAISMPDINENMQVKDITGDISKVDEYSDKFFNSMFEEETVEEEIPAKEKKKKRFGKKREGDK